MCKLMETTACPSCSVNNLEGMGLSSYDTSFASELCAGLRKLLRFAAVGERQG